MVIERKQLSRRWLWFGAVVVLIVVYFGVRSLTRERVSVHAAQASNEPLASTISTNGKVEPENNIEIHSPVSAVVKAIYLHAGDEAPAGKVLMQLDNIDAQAKVAGAESAVKSAQANLDAITRNGTLEQRQAAAADVTRNKLERDQAQRDLDALTKLNATGAASAAEVSAARQRLATAEANLHASEQSVQGRYSPAELARAQAGLEEAEASRKAAQQVLALTTVRAPSAGTIYNLNAACDRLRGRGQAAIGDGRFASPACARLFRRAGDRKARGRPTHSDQMGRPTRACFARPYRAHAGHGEPVRHPQRRRGARSDR